MPMRYARAVSDAPARPRRRRRRVCEETISIRTAIR